VEKNSLNDQKIVIEDPTRSGTTYASEMKTSKDTNKYKREKRIENSYSNFNTKDMIESTEYYNMMRKNEKLTNSIIREPERNIRSSKYLKDTHYTFKTPNMTNSGINNKNMSPKDSILASENKENFGGQNQNQNRLRRSLENYSRDIKNYVVEEVKEESVLSENDKKDDIQLYTLRSELDRLKRDKAQKEKEMELTKREMKCIKTTLVRNQKFLMELKDEMLEAKSKSFAGVLSMKDLL